jgi:hypothetical protein
MRVSAVLVIAVAVLAGCQEQKPPGSNMRARQDAALASPFDYKPGEPNSISGGGLLDFDRDAFRRDMKTVFDP